MRGARWKREKGGLGGESTCARTQSTRARESVNTLRLAGRWRRSLQFSARRPRDRSNANNAADANCR